ncbi:MAG: GNAT family N-acetyltransferase [Armatimonadota bacterium]
MAADGAELHLRGATADDAELLWQWTNDPAVRASSFSSAPIPWEEHVRWLDGVLANPDRVLWIAEGDLREPVGQVRFDRVGDHVVISVSLASTCRGRGYGPALIGAACSKYRLSVAPVEVVAYIKDENAASVRAFERAGFVRSGRRSSPYPRSLVLVLPAEKTHD